MRSSSLAPDFSGRNPTESKSLEEQSNKQNLLNYWAFGLSLRAGSGSANEEASIVRWLVRLRWIALAAQVVAGILGFKFIFLEPLLIYPYFGTVGFLCLFNLYSVARLNTAANVQESSVVGQVAVDTVALSFLLALSGGTRNPFIPLLFVHATLGALLLKGSNRAWFLVLVLACLVGLFGARDWQVLSSDIYVWELTPLFALFLSVFVTWGLVASLSDTLRKTRDNLSQSKAKESRIHHLLALGALTAEFAHQFATPLNTLRMRIARLKRKDLDESATTDLKAISETLDQSERILREMTATPLDSSMLAFEEVEMLSYLKEAVRQWETSQSFKRVNIVSSLAKNYKCRVPAKVFAKSISNLLDNASFAAPDVETIQMEISEGKTLLYIAVMDRGPGWPIDLKAQGIRPHFTTRPGGTGLGLFNCQSLCEVMGGSLELLDRNGGGAIAKLALPKTA